MWPLLPIVLGLGLVLVTGAPVSSAGPAPVATGREYLMGTVVEVRIYAIEPAAGAGAALEAALAEMRALDRLMAVQRPESQVSRVNRAGAGRAVAVDPRLIEVLESARQVSVLTDGAFDVTVQPLVAAWGFDGEAPARPDHPAAAAAGWRTVAVDAAAGTVRLGHAGAGIDLGGIAKGYALDRARAVLLDHGVTSAYLDLGGNVATLGLPPGEDAWRIGIRHPRRAGEILGTLAIGEASVSTSGDAERYVDDAAGRAGHVFDPRTGAPADALVSATVVAASATLADALSTAAVVTGAAGARAALERVGADAVLGRLEAGTVALAVSPGLDFEPHRIWKTE